MAYLFWLLFSVLALGDGIGNQTLVSVPDEAAFMASAKEQLLVSIDSPDQAAEMIQKLQKKYGSIEFLYVDPNTQTDERVLKFFDDNMREGDTFTPVHFEQPNLKNEAHQHLPPATTGFWSRWKKRYQDFAARLPKTFKSGESIDKSVATLKVFIILAGWTWAMSSPEESFLKNITNTTQVAGFDLFLTYVFARYAMHWINIKDRLRIPHMLVPFSWHHPMQFFRSFTKAFNRNSWFRMSLLDSSLRLSLSFVKRAMASFFNPSQIASPFSAGFLINLFYANTDLLLRSRADVSVESLREKGVSENLLRMGVHTSGMFRSLRIFLIDSGMNKHIPIVTALLLPDLLLNAAFIGTDNLLGKKNRKVLMASDGPKVVFFSRKIKPEEIRKTLRMEKIQIGKELGDDKQLEKIIDIQQEKLSPLKKFVRKMNDKVNSLAFSCPSVFI